jgi:hypothetical protein
MKKTKTVKAWGWFKFNRRTKKYDTILPWAYRTKKEAFAHQEPTDRVGCYHLFPVEIREIRK